VSKKYVDLYLSNIGAPTVRAHPFDDTVDLTWAKPFRLIVTLKNREAARLLLERLAEALEGEPIGTPPGA
jgi:hypothetical protein